MLRLLPLCAGAAVAVLSRLSALATGAEPNLDAELLQIDAAVVQHAADASIDGTPVSGGPPSDVHAEPTCAHDAAAEGGTHQAASMATSAATTSRKAALDSAMAALATVVAQPAVSRPAEGAERKVSTTESQANTRAAVSTGAAMAAGRATGGATEALEQAAGAAAGAAVDTEPRVGPLSAHPRPDSGSQAGKQPAAESAEPQQPVIAPTDTGLASIQGFEGRGVSNPLQYALDSSSDVDRVAQALGEPPGEAMTAQ